MAPGRDHSAPGAGRHRPPPQRGRRGAAGCDPPDASPAGRTSRSGHGPTRPGLITNALQHGAGPL
jgi:hypothetical protein